MKLVEILKLKQKDLMKELIKHLQKNGYWNNMLSTDNYIFAKGEIPILLVAHLDTVHKQAPENIYFDKEKGILWSPDGIGGDDRCRSICNTRTDKRV